MALTEKIMWKVYAGAVGAVTTIVAQKLVTKIWEASTGTSRLIPMIPRFR